MKKAVGGAFPGRMVRHQVGNVPAGWIEGKRIERAHQFEAAARYPGMVLSPQLERLIRGQERAGLIDPPLAGEQPAGEDKRLAPAAGFDQAAIHQKLIGTLLDGVSLHVRMGAGLLFSPPLP